MSVPLPMEDVIKSVRTHLGPTSVSVRMDISWTLMEPLAQVNYNFDHG